MHLSRDAELGHEANLCDGISVHWTAKRREDGPVKTLARLKREAQTPRRLHPYIAQEFVTRFDILEPLPECGWVVSDVANGSLNSVQH